MRKIAFIGTGGTMSSLGADSLDILDYGRHERRLDAPDIAAAVPELGQVAEVVPVAFRAVESSAMDFGVWHELATLCTGLAARDPDLAGIVIGHGTATLEETAYALNLTLKLAIPVVLVGSQRPLSGLSSDAHANLLGAVRVAADPASRGRGVLVVLNDEIQAAREVAKTSTTRLQTFRTPDFGILGQVDGPHVRYYRRAERRHVPDTEFDVADLARMPRVDIVTSYAGADGTAVRAFVAAGARGLVQAAFAPGMSTGAEFAALAEAVAAGVAVVLATRVGSGVAVDGERVRRGGVIGADNLSPWKARILLALALTRGRDPDEIRRVFATY
ncbi:asparaginase [Lichenibacterium ramalinae]|uniref:Asparaginase n=1 Tax=Lichenibacterium ramalinae TaxID=2316527 RepID=A0A4Q2RDD0_9HYPH|nr:asparaginase [Lichenibacterium ramalinae]RYB05257.1 asparaginase [Lichenibacterium ramalinae]